MRILISITCLLLWVVFLQQFITTGCVGRSGLPPACGDLGQIVFLVITPILLYPIANFVWLKFKK